MTQQMQDLVINDLITLLISVVTATWILGVQNGSVKTSLASIQERLARIEGMFEYRIKRDSDGP